jgi:hypothetical protein
VYAQIARILAGSFANLPAGPTRKGVGLPRMIPLPSAVSGVVVLAVLGPLLAGGRLDAEPTPTGFAQPPIGVFGEAVHEGGEVKLSYRLHVENRDGLMDGEMRLTPSQVAPAYLGGSVPSSMRSYAHIIELTWKPTEAATLFVTLPFYERTLSQYVVALDGSLGQRYDVSVRGFGDVILNGLYRVFVDEVHRIHLNLGLSLPSGSTNETAEAPAGITGVTPGSLQRLPYAMQLGSGTLSLRPGFTYNGLYRGTFWGGQLLGVLQAGTNSEGYKGGNQYEATGWLGQRWSDWFRTSFRLKWQQWFNPTGQDAQLAPALSPMDNPLLQAGQRLDALFGVDFYVVGGWLKGSRISIEAGLPVLQDLDGPQLRTDWLLTTGLQYAF